MIPYGLGSPNLVEFEKGYFVHESVVRPLESLKNAARNRGFELRVESAYRPFERQLSIWNRKARGELPLLDSDGNPMERPHDAESLMRSILIWSALPGASRHHLGTDIDVVDASACPEGYEVRLTPEECNGMFRPFHDFLTESFSRGESFGFARVFVPHRGRIMPEPWHIAHLPTSRILLRDFSLSALRELYGSCDMELKDVVIRNLESLAQDYIYPYFL